MGIKFEFALLIFLRMEVAERNLHYCLGEILYWNSILRLWLIFLFFFLLDKFFELIIIFILKVSLTSHFRSRTVFIRLEILFSITLVSMFSIHFCILSCVIIIDLFTDIIDCAELEILLDCFFWTKVSFLTKTIFVSIITVVNPQIMLGAFIISLVEINLNFRKCLLVWELVFTISVTVFVLIIYLFTCSFVTVYFLSFRTGFISIARGPLTATIGLSHLIVTLLLILRLIVFFWLSFWLN